MECRGFDAERFIWEWVMIDAQTSNFVCVQFDYFDYHVFYHVGPHVFSIVQPLINSDPYRDGCARLCQSVCATPTVRVSVITIWHRREARSHAYFHTKITLVYSSTYGYLWILLYDTLHHHSVCSILGFGPHFWTCKVQHLQTARSIRSHTVRHAESPESPEPPLDRGDVVAPS
jgi:hypothetical protein